MILTIRLTKLRKPGIVREQNGFTLIEAVIGIALLSVVGVAVLVGISTSFKASATADKISTALALAQSQIEFIHTQPYDPTGAYMRIDDPLRGADQQVLVPYTMTVTVALIDGAGADTVNDLGLQKITLKVYQANNPNPVTLVGYKVNPTKASP